MKNDGSFKQQLSNGNENIFMKISDGLRWKTTVHLINLIKLLKHGLEIDRQSSCFFNWQPDVDFGTFENAAKNQNKILTIITVKSPTERKY